MKTLKPCTNISTLLKKRLLMIIAVVVLYCGNVWGADYYWCGGSSGDWNTATNWTPNGTPGTTDTVIIDTSSNSVSISFSYDITINGLLTYGTNACNITATGGSPKNFNAATVFVGTSSDGYRTANGLPANLNVPHDNSGNLEFDGPITVSIATLDTSSWTQDISHKNIITLGSSITFNVTSKWDTGINKQTGNRDRTEINSETGTNITFSGTAVGAQESIQTLFSDLSNAGADISNAKAQTQSDQPSLYIWKGIDTTWTNNINWSTNAVPDSTASVIIPKTTNQPSASESDISSTKVKSISLSAGSELTITANYTLSDANLFIAPESGTAKIIISGKLTIPTSKDFNNEKFIIEAGTLETNAGLKAASITVNGTTVLNSTTTYLVGTTSDGITFGGDVTVNAPGISGIPVAGNVKTSSAINVTVESGVLNHINENTYRDWPSNATVILNADETHLSMSGNSSSSYLVKIGVSTGNVYIEGTGTISSIDDSGFNGTLHFGSDDPTFNETINFTNAKTFDTNTTIDLNKSCKNLTGDVDLTIKKKLTINSTQIGTLGVNLIFNNDITIADNSVNFKNVTFNANAKINGDHSFENFTATNLEGKILTINDTQTLNGILSLSGTSNGNLKIEGTGSFVLQNDQYGGEYLTVDASGPSINTGKKYYAVNSQSSDNSDISSKGWIIFTAGVWVWKGTDTSSPEDWNTADNWLPPSVPTSTAKVFISSGRTYYPTLNSASNTTIDSLTMEDNTSLNAASKLIITNPVNFDKTLSLSGLFTDTAGITNSGSITISGNTTFDGNVTNTGSISIDSGKTLSISGNFGDSGSTAATTGAISFKGTGSFTPNTGTTYSSIEINASGSTVTVADTLTTATLTITTGTIELINQATVTGNLSNSGTIDSNAEIVVQGNFTDSGTFTARANSKITLSGNTDQNFAAGSSTYKNITVNKANGKTSFITNSLNATEVILTASAGVAFLKSFSISTITDTSTTGDISFNESGTIATNTDFQTTGNVTIAQNKTLTISNSADFTHTSGTTTLEGNITAANITMGNVSLKHGITLTGNVTLSGGANAGNKKSLDDSTSHTMTIKGNLIINDFYEIGTTRNQTIILDPVTGTITNNGTLSVPHSSSFTGDFKNNGTFTAGGTTVAINGNLTNTGSITINSGKTFRLSKNFSNSGTATLTGSTFELITTTPSQITGKNTFHNFTCTVPGKKISFEAGNTQTVSGKLTLTGTSGDNNKISLRSTSPGTQWEINCTGANNHSISFVDVQDSDNISLGYRLTATNSTDSGNNVRWDFSTVTYTWLGNNTNWFDESNWDKGSVPGIGVKAIIPVVTSPKVYPILEEDLLTDQSAKASIGSSGTITVEADAQIDFADKSLTANTITNKGRIRLKGNQRITATTFENVQGSTVEYYGLCSDNQMNGNSGSFNYYNLEFTNGATGNITSDITIGGRTLIANGTGNELKLSGNNTVTGVVTIGTQTPSPVSAGNIVLNSNTLIAIEDSIFCDSLTLSNDLIIDADAAGTPKDVITTGTISAQNIVLYRGHIKAEPNSILSATRDILILGSEYNIANPESGNPAEFLYQQQRGTPTANPSYARPDFTVAVSRPDGTQLPTITGGTVPFSGSYSASSGSCLKAGKNFYANGTILNSQDSAQWYIDLPDITNSSNGFAETAYSTIRYATIRCYINGSADGSFARMPAYYCADNGNNLNWLFDNLLITEVHTVRDNAIQITFNRPIRNLHGELTHPDSIKRLYNSNGNNYVSFHTAPDCTDENKLSNQNIASGIVFLKAAESWNTDATGTSAGTPDSTDRKGNHKEIIPYLEVKNVTENNAASGIIHITDIWGKKIGNYEGSNRFTAVTDRTGPVLYSIRTGQELHTPYDNSIGAESQPSYDSHNFIEFRYSEEVNFGDSTLAGASPETPVFDNEDTSANIWLPAAGSTLTEDLPDIVNVRVHDSFGALTNDVTQTGNLHFAGLGIVQNGQIFTGSNGSPDKYVNSLYRTDKFSIRLSIAGYTTGTVPDRAGAFYKNWPGYIESAVQPSGNFQMTSTVNPFVSDCALALDGTTPVYNPQELYAADQTIPQVNVLTSTGVPYEDHNTYGKWDISEPVFAPLRLDTKTAWGTKDYYEAVGNKSGSGSTLDKIEFHFFDNTPTYTSSDTATWLTEKGWVQNTTEGSTTLYDASYTYSADIIGGSRQFSTDEAYRTSGGIRYSTITTAAPAFKYIDSQSVNAVPTKDFVSGTAGVYIGAKASLFTGYAATRHSPTNPDDLYFGLGLSETDIPISKSFTISYDDSKAYVTDLAGNRLRSATIKTIDRTPPSFDIVISPVNQKEIYMVFVKNVVTNSADIRYIDNDGNVISITENFDNLISKCFDIISINSDGEGEVSETHHIDYSVPAKIEHITSQTNKEEFTSIKITLQEPVTLEAIENMYLRIISPEGYEEFSRDPVTSINDTRVTFIQDKLGNYIQMYDIHALSDFAVNSINTLYAYDADMTYDGENIMNGLYEEGSWAVHDWNEDQQNYGTLPANHPFGIVADVENGTGLTDCIPAGVRIFLSANPDSDSISSQYNSDLNQQLRIWLPEVTNGLFPSISLKNNSVDNYVQIDSTLLNKDESPFRIHFEIPKEISESWGANQQISFMYGLLNKDGSPFRIYPSPYHNAATGKYDLSQSVALPLYAFRLKDPSDITSIDLWSFKTRSITEQRGGVTILNNVINATNGEKTVVKVNMPTAGKLNVMVMTLDGNIITYLNHGETQAGEHYYSWDGKNNKKGIVARGMYFIRVVGNGLDETRKVMVVK